MDALKAQLRFRQHILMQEADPALYRFSECSSETSGKRINPTPDELKENLLKLITKASSSTDKNCKQSLFLVGKRVRHFFKQEGEDEVSNVDSRYPVEGKVISTVPGYPEWFNIKYADDAN